MSERAFSYTYLLMTIGFTVFGQLMMKWRIGALGRMPDDSGGKLHYVGGALLDPGILLGLFAGLLAALSWLATLNRFPLSFAYPFMALNFVIVVIASRYLFNEPLSASRMLGVGLIILGTWFVGRS